MKTARWLRRFTALFLSVLLLSLHFSVMGGSMNTYEYSIIIGNSAGAKQEYAAAELQKYLYQLTGETALITTQNQRTNRCTFLLGTPDNNPKIANKNLPLAGLSEEGYVIDAADNTVVIASPAEQGVLYGVYGLLEDYYGVGFYFSGDVLPQQKKPLPLLTISETKEPEQSIRGVLPWTNFPQSATSYSLADWKYVIDQMTKMRMNFLNIHNYNGMSGHNEVFHNYTIGGVTSRVWNATASKGHAWGGPSWDVNQYLFGAADLFDDYDFGTDATLYNDNLSNLEVSQKGASEFQIILEYAHQKGVKVGLGIELDLVMPDYGLPADDKALNEARANQIVSDYPNLDYLLLYRSEVNPDLVAWNKAFDAIYPVIKKKAPNIKIGISGWGLPPETVTDLPEDIIVAPISGQGVNDLIVDGSAYSNREFWACPWVERDYDDSQWFATYKMKLSNIINTYQKRSENTKGLMTLTWRLTDAVDPKISYIAKAPWDSEKKYTTAEAVYREYAAKNYGEENADSITEIINQNEAFATNFAECEFTPEFAGKDRFRDINKAIKQIQTVDKAISATSDTGNKYRLQKLRARLEAVQAYCKLDEIFNQTEWVDLAKGFERFVTAFTSRVDDISSLGNVVSVQNRLVQLRYLTREEALRAAQTVKAPSNVVAKNTQTGAFLSWKGEEENASGYYIYRGDTKLNRIPVTQTCYTDIFDGEAVYRIAAVSECGITGTKSIPVTCMAGNSDEQELNVIVISPPNAAVEGQGVDLKATILDNSIYESLSATLYYRAIGEDTYRSVPMQRRTKSTFGIRLPASELSSNGMEYYIQATDGKNSGVYPKTAPQLAAVCSVVSNPSNTLAPAPPSACTVSHSGRLSWTPAQGPVHWYRVYRGTTADFTLGPQSFVTYLDDQTTSFLDIGKAFNGTPLTGTWYYKITAVDLHLNESQAISSGPVLYGQPVSQRVNFCDYDEAAAGVKGEVQFHFEGDTRLLAFISNQSYSKYTGINFGQGAVRLSVEYATPYTGSSLEIWLDGKDAASGGQLLGSFTFSSTGSWLTLRTETMTFEEQITGIHDMYFVNKGGDAEYLHNLKDFILTTRMPETGDVDGDGEITSVDSLEVLRHTVGLTHLTDTALQCADTDANGEIDSVDALLILRYIVGLEPFLPPLAS